MEIKIALDTFRWQVMEASKLISLSFSMDAAGNYVHDELTRNFISDNAFLKIFIAWESYLESVFLGYLLGEKSLTGKRIRRCVFPKDKLHANKILIGTQRYVDWSSHDNVKKFADLYLKDGEPFKTVLSSIQQDLQDLKSIRNAAAHISSTTQQAIDGVAARRLNNPTLSNVSVSGLLYSPDPLNPTQTVLDYYLTFLDAAAEAIANA